MKTLAVILVCALFVLFSCKSGAPASTQNPQNTSDTLRISHPDIEYDIIIIDPGFHSWFAKHAKPRGHHSQSYLEGRNALWVLEWNQRVAQPQRFGSSYGMYIDYRPGVDYGYEVNYMLFYYLTYFQLQTKQRLGGFEPHY